jgi:hypothetical protein
MGAMETVYSDYQIACLSRTYFEGTTQGDRVDSQSSSHRDKVWSVSLKFVVVVLLYKLLQTAQLIQQITQCLNHLRQSTSTLTGTIALEQLAAKSQNACRMA